MDDPKILKNLSEHDRKVKKFDCDSLLEDYPVSLIFVNGFPPRKYPSNGVAVWIKCANDQEWSILGEKRDLKKS